MSSRYECLKTVKEEPTRVIIFKAGDVYPSTKFHLLGPEWICLIDIFGDKKYFAGSFITEHFRELDDAESLPIPEAGNHESDEYAMMYADPGCTRTSIGMCALGLLTMAAIIYLTLKWAS